MLPTGTRAPDFRVFSTDGTRVSLADFRGQRLVLFFFPRAFGPGATVEARRFRDSAVALAQSGVALLGVSPDTHSRQCDFARAERLPFPLVADAEGTLCRAYGARGALWPLVHAARRVAYVLDEAGRVEAVFGAGLSAARQVDAVLAFLKSTGGRVRSLRALPSPGAGAASSGPRAVPRLRLVHSA